MSARTYRFSAALVSVFLLALAALALPFLVVTYPPAVDLPQHAAQVAMMRRFDDPACDLDAELELNWRSPYLLANLAALGLSHMVAVPNAVRACLALAVLAVPVAFAVFIRAIRGPPEWAFLGFPIAYSFSVHWGFFVFAFAIPIGFLYLAAAVRYGERPTLPRALGMAMFSVVLFAAHALLAAFCGGVSVLIVVARRSSSLRRSFLATLPLAAAAPFAWWWSQTVQGRYGETRGLEWFYEADRLSEVLSRVVGEPAALLPTLFGALVLGLPWLLGSAPSRKPLDWLPLYAAVIWFLGAPGTFFGTGQTYARFHVYLPALMLLGATPPLRSPRWSRALLALAAFGWSAVLGVRWFGFERESADFRRLLADMEPDRRVYSLVIDRNSDWSTQSVYLHFPLWYQTTGGCLVEPSFVRAFPMLVRYRPGHDPGLPMGIEWSPMTLDFADRLGDRYDGLLVRSDADPRGSVIAPDRVAISAQHGSWWFFDWLGGEDADQPAGRAEREPSR